MINFKDFVKMHIAGHLPSSCGHCKSLCINCCASTEECEHCDDPDFFWCELLDYDVYCNTKERHCTQVDFIRKFLEII